MSERFQRIIPQERMSKERYDHLLRLDLIAPFEEFVGGSDHLYYIGQYEDNSDGDFITVGEDNGNYYLRGRESLTLGKDVWLALPGLHQPTRDACYISAVIFYALFNEKTMSINFDLYAELMKMGLERKKEMKDRIAEAGSITGVVGDLFDDSIQGRFVAVESDESYHGVIGVRCLPRPKKMQEEVREIEQQAIEGGNLEIVTNDNGEEWWSWHNGHALAVVASFWFHRYAKQGLILFDPMAGRLILEFEENIERWMYPEGERIKTVFFSEKFGMLSSMMYLAESQGTTFEEYCQRVFGG